MNNADFDFVANLVRTRSGLVLERDKVYLIESRLTPLARRRGLAGLDDYVGRVRMGRDEAMIVELVEAMTTNESFFFRDVKPFEIFRHETLPALIRARAGARRLRIWSAACSSGQEPYSLAMILQEEAARLAGWHIEIVGTDLSTEMLDRARNGLYSQFEVQRGLTIHQMVKYFTRVRDQWQISPELSAMVHWRKFNLLDDMAGLGVFDVVFCRNVLIYFDQKTKTSILDRISRQIPTDGALYLGGAETVLGTTQRFRPIPGQRGVYALAA